MKLISFDIGIKNMAYCFFDVSGGEQSIIDWNVLNLMEEEVSKVVCTCNNKAKNKKSQPTVCTKYAKFKKNGQYFCEKHAKTSGFLLPTKECSQTQLKKMKNEGLITVCNKYKVLEFGEGYGTKKDLLEKMDIFFKMKCLDPIIEKKQKTAGQTDLILIGKNMKILLNQVVKIDEVTHVVIENQISPIANRMKTIQGMLAQYFIMKNSDTEIDFVSSFNKLKGMDVTKVQTDCSQNTLIEPNAKYKQHKKDGVTYCMQLLEQNPNFITWKHVLETKKKDDLADCFLQGMWYIRK
jgi:hypothetical protein